MYDIGARIRHLEAIRRMRCGGWPSFRQFPGLLLIPAGARAVSESSL
jgi:hypothetical protein